MNVFEKIKSRPTAYQQIALLLCSSFGGSVLSIAVSVLNTRYLSPEEYGDVRYVNNVIIFLSSFLFLGYFVSGSRLLAIEKLEVRKRCLRGTMVLIMLVIIMATIVLLFFYSFFVREQGTLQQLIWFSIPVCSAPILLSYINTTLQGDNHIGRISLARTLPALLYLPLGFLCYTCTGASSIKMLLLQNGVAVIILSVIIASTKPVFKRIPLYFRRLQVENHHYGWPVYYGSIATVSLGYLAGITLGFFSKNNSNVAFYTMALALSGPLAMLPSIIGTVYFKRFAIETCISRRVICGTLLITVVTWIFFSLLIKPTVTFFYPASYSEVSSCTIWTSLGMAVHGFGDMFNRFLGAHGLGRQIRNGAILSGLVLLAGNIILVYFWSLDGAIITRILGSAASCGSMVYYYRQFVRGKFNATS